MGAIPRSLRVFVRDVVVLLVIAFALGLLLDAWATHVDDLNWWRASLAGYADAQRQAIAMFPGSVLGDPPPELRSLDWGSVAGTARAWMGALALWVAACWVATRARAGLRTVWVPGALAAGVVVARTVAALLSDDFFLPVLNLWPAPDSPVTLDPFLRFPELWPGPVAPVTLGPDGSLTVLAWHPAWGFAPLVLALVLAASWLGARAGRLPDDPASKHVAPTTRAGRVLAAVVVGLPALLGIAGAVVSYLAGTRDAGFVTTHSIVIELLAPLVSLVLAAALLSGTGSLGGTLIVVASLPMLVRPVFAWANLEISPLALGEVAGVAVACAAVALWRPAAAWGGEILGTGRRPAGVPGQWDALASPPVKASNPVPMPPGL
jgi:hypothetical protein